MNIKTGYFFPDTKRSTWCQTWTLFCSRIETKYLISVPGRSIHRETTILLNRYCLSRKKHSSGAVRVTWWNKHPGTGYDQTNVHEPGVGQKELRTKQFESRLHLAYNRHVRHPVDTLGNIFLTSMCLSKGEKLTTCIFNFALSEWIWTGKQRGWTWKHAADMNFRTIRLQIIREKTDDFFKWSRENRRDIPNKDTKWSRYIKTLEVA